MKITSKQVTVLMWVVAIGAVLLIYCATSSAAYLAEMVSSAITKDELAGYLLT